MKSLLLGFCLLISMSALAENCESGNCEFNFSQCTANANSMKTSSAENQMRNTCFSHFKNSITFSQCTANANSMKTSSAENEMRELCFTHCL